MKKLTPYLQFFGFWLIYFITAKIVFLLYFLSLTRTLSGVEIFNVFRYGFRMDLSFAAYICLVPFLLFFIASLFPRFQTQKIIRIYSYVLIFVLSFLMVADLGLYKSWGFRMDDTPLIYFKSPKELLTTASSAPLFILILLFCIIVGLFIFLYHRYFDKRIKTFYSKRNIWNIFLSLFLIAILFIPIRGGIQKIPLNISDVYFSEKIFADHAAINLPWNVMFSILNRNEENNPFDYFSLEDSKKLVNELYNTGSDTSTSILSNASPNLVFIILESFTAKWVGALGGVKDATPELNKIAQEGLLFTNIYATGDRSEKGIMGILSGYPNQAITSIIKTPNKTRNLQSITKTLKNHGYHSSFFYGGELEFANIKSYLVNSGFDQLSDKYDYPISKRTTSWGVHDEFLFEKFSDHLKNENSPFFSVAFTLSSHEPYDVPLRHFNTNDETSKFKNSIFYTDSLLGKFIEKSKNTDWWKNTLVVIVADHGHPIPGNDANDAPSKFHIPLIFTGGALTQRGSINAVGSQSDIITTILHQMNIKDTSFVWGKDLLNPGVKQFAFYSFNNGFGWITPGCFATFDNVSRKPIQVSTGFDTSDLKYGKAYMEYSYEDFLKR